MKIWFSFAWNIPQPICSFYLKYWFPPLQLRLGTPLNRPTSSNTAQIVSEMSCISQQHHCQISTDSQGVVGLLDHPK